MKDVDEIARERGYPSATADPLWQMIGFEVGLWIYAVAGPSWDAYEFFSAASSWADV